MELLQVCFVLSVVMSVSLTLLAVVTMDWGIGAVCIDLMLLMVPGVWYSSRGCEGGYYVSVCL